MKKRILYAMWSLLLAGFAACSGGETPTNVVTPPDTTTDTVPTPAIDPRSMTLAFLDGPPTTDTIQAIPAALLRVRVTDPASKPVAHQIIQFAASSSAVGVQVAETPISVFVPVISVFTDATGVASARVRMGTRVGLSTLTVTIPTNPNTVKVSYIVNVGRLDHATISPADVGVPAGQSLQLTYSLFDRFQNTRPDTLSFSTHGNALSVSPTGLVTGLAGGPQYVAYESFTDGRLFKDSTVMLGMPTGHIIWNSNSKLVDADLGGAPGAPVTSATQDNLSYLGTTLVFSRGGHIVLRTTSGAETTLDLPAGVRNASWPGGATDSTWIYFQSLETDFFNHVARVHPDGSGFQDLMPKGAGGMPTVSPDGKKVAFMFPLQVLDIASLRTDTVATSVAQCSPRWSPDGQWIAFFDTPGGECTKGVLYLVRPDGRDKHQLGVKTDWSPGISWSPDSKWLLLTEFGLRVTILDVATGASHDLGWVGNYPIWAR